MAIRSKDIYQENKKTHKLAKVITAVLLVLVVLAVAAFFWLRQYCVYDDQGNARLILPWSSSETAEEAE